MPIRFSLAFCSQIDIAGLDKATDKPWLKRSAGMPNKVLLHLVVWRQANDYDLLDSSLEISHCDADHNVLNLIAESHDENESRKYCHLFGWYAVLPGETEPRCPHREWPCTGV